MKSLTIYFLLICATIFVACGPTKHFEKSAAHPIPNSFSVDSNAVITASTNNSNVGNISYKEFFQDGLLIQLIDSVLKNNYDALIAFQRVEVAMAEYTRRKMQLLPAVNGFVNNGIERFGDYTMTGVGNFDTNLSDRISKNQVVNTPLVPEHYIGFRAAWEVDIWGKLKADREAGKNRFLSSKEAVHWLKINLVSITAGLYYDLMTLDAENNMLLRNIKLQEDALALMKVQLEAGKVNSLAVQQFQGQLIRTKAMQLTVAQSINVIENKLLALQGKFNGKILRSADLMSQPIPSIINVGNVISWLSFRPDIVGAKFESEAALLDVKSAKAAFKPSLVLMPSLGLNSFNASLLFRPESAALGLMSSIIAPVFQQGNLKARYTAAGAQAEEQWLRYQQVVNTAYQEVKTAQANITLLKEQYALKQQEWIVQQDAVNTSLELFKAGYANYLEVIAAQKAALEVDFEKIITRQQLQQQWIDYYKALGGGRN